jgi:hypothetical protein
MKKTSFVVSRRNLLLSFFTLLFLAIIIFQINGWFQQKQTQEYARMERSQHYEPSPASSATGNLSHCLPANIRLADIVSATLISFSSTNGYNIKKTTVEQKLIALNAYCNANGKLVDGAGREIYFYHLTGCWGNAPSNYLDILGKQRQEIEELSQQYTVIEMTCNPSGIPLA